MRFHKNRTKILLILLLIIFHIVGALSFAELIITKPSDDFGFLDILFGYLIGMSVVLWISLIYLAFRHHPFLSIIITIILIVLYAIYGKFALNIPDHLIFLQSYMPHWVQVFLLQWLTPVLAITIIFSMCITSTLTILLSIISTWYLIKKKKIEAARYGEISPNYQYLSFNDKCTTYLTQLKRMRNLPKNAFELFYAGSLAALCNSILYMLVFSIILLMMEAWHWYYMPLIFLATFIYHLLYDATTLDEIKIFDVCFQSLPSSATLFLGLFLFDISYLYNFGISGLFFIIQMIGLYTGILKNPITLNFFGSSSSSSSSDSYSSSDSSSSSSSDSSSDNRSGGGGNSGGGGASSDW